MKYPNPQRGFTLVEIAIVLVIIGLLLGGILKGQELIEQARIKRVVNDFNNITAAVLTYQDRYGYLPGDDLNAAARWGSTSSGDGNGLLDTVTFLPAPPTESNIAWQHLRLSGLVPGAPTTLSIPQTPWSTFYGVGTGDYYGWGANTSVFCASSIPAKAAEQLDRQFDDGNPSTGNVRANTLASPTTEPGAAATTLTVYQDLGGANTVYTVCKRL